MENITTARIYKHSKGRNNIKQSLNIADLINNRYVLNIKAAGHVIFNTVEDSPWETVTKDSFYWRRRPGGSIKLTDL